MNALILSAVLGVVMMLSGLWIKDKSITRVMAIVGAVLLLIINIAEMRGVVFFNFNLTGMLGFDRFSLLFVSVILFATLAYFLLSGSDIQKVGSSLSEYYALIFFILCGAIIVASFKSLLLLFLGVEIISIPLYILTGSDKRNLKSNEAGLKYFLMGAFSTGVMLMGITFIYGATGVFNIDQMTIDVTKNTTLIVAGVLLLLFSLSFKVSAAPFHFWTPDVYDGAPTVFTSFMASIVKVSFFIGFIKLFSGAFMSIDSKWKFWVAVICALTLLVGNLTAVFQQSVKRMLSYSSISQAGFMLLALLSLQTGDAFEGILLYAVAYSLATVGIFSVLAKMPDFSFEGFRGLGKSQPLVAACLAVFVCSLAGIPLTAGFLAKFYMLKATIASSQYLWLAIFAVLMAAVSVYYYFRLIQAMYFKEGDADLGISPSFKFTLAGLALVIILLGIFPNYLLFWYYF